jgi:hypothetical protein
MKKIMLLLGIMFVMVSCEIYEEPTNPAEYMSGGKWVFYDYEIAIVGAISTATYIKTDTICVDSFNDVDFGTSIVSMKQRYGLTPRDRRFIIGQTMWEFDGYHMYCDFINDNGTLHPIHQPYWVDYTSFLLKDDSQMTITNYDNGDVTRYTYDTNNNGFGTAPPSKMTLISTPVVTNLYSDANSYDKAVTVRYILKFMR